MKLTAMYPKSFSGGGLDLDAARELADVQAYLDAGQAQFEAGIIGLMPLRGEYVHADRRLRLVFLLANMTEEPIVELHGVMRLCLNGRDAQVAKATLDFDEAFMGELPAGGVLVVHLPVPVKGLTADEVFGTRGFAGAFDEVRITPAGVDGE